MERTSVRDLKAELLSELAEGSRGTPLVKAWSVAPAEVLALGVAPGPDGRDRLAVRLDRDGPASQEVVARLVERAAGEVDVRVTGPVRVLPASGPLPGSPGSSAPGLANAHLPGLAPAGPGSPPSDTLSVDTGLRRRTRPLVPGLSVAHPAVTAGTLGALVLVGGRPGVLSNSHVLADSGRAALGDAMLQPAPYDGGDVGRDRIGELVAHGALSTDRPNAVDVAAGVLDDPGLAGENVVPGLTGPMRLRGVTDDPPADDRVGKIGRTTGWTTGRVTAVELDGVQVAFDSGVLVFDGLVEVEGEGALPFSRGGDSGSTVYTLGEGLALGLLFAGGETGGSNGQGLTFACPFSAALAAVGATLL